MRKRKSPFVFEEMNWNETRKTRSKHNEEHEIFNLEVKHWKSNAPSSKVKKGICFNAQAIVSRTRKATKQNWNHRSKS